MGNKVYLNPTGLFGDWFCLSNHMELHLETITPEMRELISEFGNSEISSRFYLAGGTALALQLGHRNLYFICQVRPLKKLFELAATKYPSVRDFELQVAKRLAYFEMADQEIDPILVEPVN